LLPFVGEGRADDVTQSFFLKLYERNFLKTRPAITGRFRNWIYVAARRHAIDEWRKVDRRPERADSFSFDIDGPIHSRAVAADDGPFDPDEVHALSVLHLALLRLKKHLIEDGRTDLWMIFDELLIAPLIPGRVAKDREDIRAMFPGEPPGFLDNRLTTVKRIFRRMLPALIPIDPTESLTLHERYREIETILRGATNSHLWLALLMPPEIRSNDTSGSSLDLPPRSAYLDAHEAAVSRRVIHEELRILLGFWLELPLYDFLDDLEAVGPAVSAAIAESRLAYDSAARRVSAGLPFNLRRLIAGVEPPLVSIPPNEWLALLQCLKTFSKGVYRASQQRNASGQHGEALPRESTIPLEVAHVLYNLANALALLRCGARIIRIKDDQFRKNVKWVLDQNWLAAELRPIFLDALKTLDSLPNP
jgi:hypothetical protein